MDVYWNLKRQSDETVQDFLIRFNSVYDFIPTDIKPPPGLTMLHYPDGFDAEIVYYLRVRNSSTLEDMQKNVNDVEMNLLIRRSRMDVERRKVIKEEFPPLLNLKLETLMKTMERFMNTFIFQDKPVVSRQQKVPHFQEDMEEGEVVESHHQKVETGCFVASFERSLEQQPVEDYQREDVRFQQVEENSDHVCVTYDSNE